MTLAASLDLPYRTRRSPPSRERRVGQDSPPCARQSGPSSSPFVGTVLVTFLSARGSRGTAPSTRFFDPTNVSLAGLALGSLIIGILGVLSITGEYGSSTIRSSLVATPRRAVFFGAKAIVSAASPWRSGLVLSFLAFFEGQAVLSGAAPTATLADPGVLRALIESGVFLALLTLFGLGIGAIIRHSVGRHRGLRGMHASSSRSSFTAWPETLAGSCPR